MGRRRNGTSDSTLASFTIAAESITILEVGLGFVQKVFIDLIDMIRAIPAVFLDLHRNLQGQVWGHFRGSLQGVIWTIFDICF